MKKNDYKLIEQYMLSSMEDSAHDKDHIYRVLYTALEIAEGEKDVDYDVLIAACLLHDIGRVEQFKDPSLDHAEVGAEKALKFLKEHGFSEEFSKKVASCIRAHRFRTSNPPQTIEEKILFDSDKVDVTGAMGIARTLFYAGEVGEGLYSLKENGEVSDGTGDKVPSFFGEYKFKLEGLYSHFYTSRGRQLAKERQKAAVEFYESMLRETKQAYDGSRYVDKHLTE